LLIIAAVAAMVLAHVERDERKPTQKAVARARIRSGRPQPLPGPGVLSSGDAIGTPALLPDGSPSADSVLVATPGRPQLPGVEYEELS
jgi:NADH-quinone oxidoreductase subunit J